MGKVLTGAQFKAYHRDGFVALIGIFSEEGALHLRHALEAAGVDESKAVTFDLRPGQMSLHSARIIHSSLPNRSDDRRIGVAIQSYVPPSVKQVIKPVPVQLARGEDTHDRFELIGRPKQDRDPEGVTTRDRVNAIWSDILFHGAKQRRDH